jgi:mannosyltransferase OCH1-like enzyme
MYIVHPTLQYGGIYTDIDNTPKKFNADTIAPEEDAFFQVESAGIPSQWFMAASPRHPIMFFAVERILINLLNLQDTGLLKIVWTTGPGAIKEAFNLFRRQTGDYLKAGLYVGTESRTVRLVGEQANEHEYVWRNSIKEKQEAYEAMDMKHLTRMGMTKGGETNLTCFEQLYRVEEKKNRLSPELNMW